MPATGARCLWFLSVLALLLSGLGIARGEEKPCTTHAKGNYYDLSRLSSSKDYEFDSASGQSYILNVCKSVSHEIWAPKVDRPEDVAGFTRRAHGDFSLGDVNTTVVVREGEPFIFMTDGSRCPSGGDLTASTAIRFICDTSAGTGKPKMIATLPPTEETACAFFVEWRTEMACPASEGVVGTIISVLAIIVAVLFAAYIVGGFLYNRYVLELRGMDQIPRVSFFSFSDTVESVRNCMERARDRSSDAWHSRNWGAQDWHSGGGSWGGSGRHGYSGLRSTPEEAQTMLIGGPPGFLDEESEEDEEAPPPPPHPHSEQDGRPSGMDVNGVIRL